MPWFLLAALGVAGCARAPRDGATVDDPAIVAAWRTKLERIAKVEGFDVLERVWTELGYMPVINNSGAVQAGGWRLFLESGDPDFTEPFLRHDDRRKIELTAPVFALFLGESIAVEEPPSVVGDCAEVLVGTPDLFVLIEFEGDTFGRMKRARPVREEPPADISFEEAVRRVQEAHRTLADRLERRMRDDLQSILDQPSDEAFERELADRLGVRIPKTVDGAHPLRGGWRMVEEAGTLRFVGPAGASESVPSSVFIRFFSEDAGMTRSAPQASAATTGVCVGARRHVLLIDAADGTVRRIAR